MKVTPPGPARSWTEMLPAPWDQNPEVVVVMAPSNARFQAREIPGDNRILGCLSVGEKPNQRVMGLQVLSPLVDNYFETEKIFASVGATMVMPGHIGRLSEMPQRLLMSSDFIPLVFLKHAMSTKYLNLRQTGMQMAGGELN